MQSVPFGAGTDSEPAESKDPLGLPPQGEKPDVCYIRHVQDGTSKDRGEQNPER